MHNVGTMNIKFIDIGDPLLDGHPHGNRDMWHYAFGKKYSQIGTYLEDLYPDKIQYTTNAGIIEIPLKTWYSVDKLINWFSLLSKEQRKLIKRKYLLFSYAMEPYTDLFFKEIVKFADFLNKPYDEVAVAVSNSNAFLNETTPIMVFALKSGWMQWFSRRWIDRDIKKFKKPDLEWKHYICLNARPRPHRMIMLGVLAENNLLEYGHTSFGAGSGTILGTLVDGPITPDIYEKLCKKTKINVFNSLKQKLPIKIDNVQYQFDWSTNAGLEIVNDALVDNAASRNECGSHYSTYTLTEKTWRPIYFGMPILLRSTVDSIEYTKSIGYHLFDDLHNNTPETIVNFVKEYITWDRTAINNFRLKERTENKKLFIHHSTVDVDNLFQQVKEWIS